MFIRPAGRGGSQLVAGAMVSFSGLSGGSSMIVPAYFKLSGHGPGGSLFTSIANVVGSLASQDAIN
jgi:hypothetical protein